MPKVMLGLSLLMLSLIGCSGQQTETVELVCFPVDNTSELIAQSGVELDQQISSDGNGSLRISADGTVSVPLYEVRDLDVDNGLLVYQARVRTENVTGRVFLEMWCGLGGGGEYFSRDLETPLTGTTNWSTEVTPFLLKKGQRPEYVKLNLVIEGKGTAWIDDVRLLRSTA